MNFLCGGFALKYIFGCCSICEILRWIFSFSLLFFGRGPSGVETWSMKESWLIIGISHAPLSHGLGLLNFCFPLSSLHLFLLNSLDWWACKIEEIIQYTWRTRLTTLSTDPPYHAGCVNYFESGFQSHYHKNKRIVICGRWSKNSDSKSWWTFSPMMIDHVLVDIRCPYNPI